MLDVTASCTGLADGDCNELVGVTSAASSVLGSAMETIPARAKSEYVAAVITVRIRTLVDVWNATSLVAFDSRRNASMA